MWASVDTGNIRDSWIPHIGRLVFLLSAIQQIGATEAEQYVLDALDAQGISSDSDGRIRSEGFAGVASDGRPLDSLLYQPVPATLTAIDAGSGVSQALAVGWAALDMIVSTQVADSFRSSASVAYTTKPHVTMYVRMLVPPSCSRCAILAGAYSSRTAFRRHPRCDCVAIPSTEATSSDLISDARVDPKYYFNSLSRAEQDRVFTLAGAQAIRDGADIGQVVNARRRAAGMSAAQPTRIIRRRARETGVDINEISSTSGGRRSLRRVNVLGEQVFVTFEGRPVQLPGGGVAPRLMPESIYEISGDRDQVLRLLRLHGYIY